LEIIKESASLINTSRGPLINETALLETLRKGRIRGAALDVFEIEPLLVDSSRRSEELGKQGKSNVFLTPHMRRRRFLIHGMKKLLRIWNDGLKGKIFCIV